MQMFFRVSAALGLGLILLAAGEAPNVEQDALTVLQAEVTALQKEVDSLQGSGAVPTGVASALTADTAAVGPLMLTGTEIPESRLEIAIPAMKAPDAAISETEQQPKPASLAQMVKQMRSAPADLSDSFHCLATAVYWESKGEPLDGQLAVAQVILNRVEDGRFGRSICAVVKAPKQFSFVRGGALPAPVSKEQWKTAQAIASIALADAWHEIVPDATHFHATRVSPGWKMRRVASVGNHVFYR